MKRVVVPLALACVASFAMACPGSKADMNAQAPSAEKLALMTAPTAATPARAVSAKPAAAPSATKPATNIQAAKKATGV